MIKRIFLTLLIALFQYQILLAMNGNEIMKKVYTRKEGSSVRMDLRMTLINRMGRKRVRVFSVVRRNEQNSIKSFFEFKSPSDVKGVKFLSVDPMKKGSESMRWLYLPAMKRVQRVSGSSRNDYFMGSDFTYNDLKKRHVDDEIHKLIGTKMIGDISCWIVESVPVGNKDIYSKRISFIDKKTFIPVLVDYYSKKGEKVKILKVSDIENVNGILIAKKLEMENLKKNHKTIIEISDMKLNTKISNSIFSPARIERSRIR